MANTVDILGYPHVYELTPSTHRSCVLVFVHGWLLSREYWEPLIHQLSQDYQCLSYEAVHQGVAKEHLDHPAPDLGSVDPRCRERARIQGQPIGPGHGE
ncbi:MAG: hypothetical protein AAF327_02080, partial [Cyanobacteria bacterium P01_A01_bin.37]